MSALIDNPLWRYRDALLSGLATSLMLAATAILLGLLVGTLLLTGARARQRTIRWLAVGFIEAWRNTPLFVQLIWVHFALPIATGVPLQPTTSGLIAMSCNAGAYFSETLRAGVEAVPRGQWEAGRSLGLSTYALWRTVVGPQVVRLVLPGAVNMAISVFKGTTLLSILQVGEFLEVVNRVSNFTFRHVEIFSAALVAYLIPASALDALARRLELRLAKGRAR
jgi:His/Glu/Gln/Arg/opine family amino acid ABC transporter permease subunit